MKFSEDDIEYIKYITKIRKDKNETRNCVFYITIPRCTNSSNEFEDNIIIDQVKKILIRNKIEYQVCDTVPGSFNLNRDFIETLTPLECTIGYSGTFPVNWDPIDVLTLHNLDSEGYIYILVYYLDKNGKISEFNH